MNPHLDAWLNLIYERDQVYLYIFIAVVVGFLWYGWLKLRRYFKLVLAALLVLVAIGLIWGYYQLPS